MNGDFLQIADSNTPQTGQGVPVSPTNPVPVSLVGGSSGPDRELVVTTYSVKTAFTGASVGDTITCVRVLDVSATTPTTVATIWRNETTNTDLGSAPSAANLLVLGKDGATETTLSALSAKVPALASGRTPVIAADLPLPTGAATEASLLTRLTEATFAAFGAVFGTQADASAGSSGGAFSHMSFMKRLALYLDIIQGKLPGSLGAKTGATSLSVVPATDAGLAMGAQLPAALGPQASTTSLSTVPANFASASVASVASSTASQALLAASTTRMGAIIFNNSTGILYLRLGQAVSIGGHSMRLMPYESLVLEAADYRGSIFGIWDVANGNALVTQMSA